MKIDCISDLHGDFPILEGGDLLIIAGDLTAKHTEKEFLEFIKWLKDQEYREKIFIAGNHDTMIENHNCPWRLFGKDIIYLCDYGTEFEGLKIWGTPWTKTFDGINQNCCAFTLNSEEDLAKKWSMIPNDVDILISHGPPFGYCDYRPFNPQEIKRGIFPGYGSQSLFKRMMEMEDGRKRFLVCGHIHEGAGAVNYYSEQFGRPTWKIINASIMNENYNPVNSPISIAYNPTSAMLNKALEPEDPSTEK